MTDTTDAPPPIRATAVKVLATEVVVVAALWLIGRWFSA